MESVNGNISEGTFPILASGSGQRSSTSIGTIRSNGSVHVLPPYTGGSSGSSNPTWSNERMNPSSFPRISSTSGSIYGSLSNNFHFPNIFEQADTSSFPTRSNIRWKKSDILGQGAFGVVSLGLNIETGELMAVKQMTIDEVSAKELSTLQNEIDLLKKLHHPNIVRYIGTEVNATNLSIFLEYVPGGSLKALIDKFGALDEAVVKSYTRQLLLGLEYLHRHGIAHRDIKGANCLVGSDGVVKLADFGNSKQWRHPTSLTSHQHSTHGDITGTPCWMAPEVVKEKAGNIPWKKSDVWSLACTTLEMASGLPPWSQFSNAVTILYHIACQEDSLPVYPASASPELLSFFQTCLRRDCTQRPDTTLLLLHPFVANISSSMTMSSAGYGHMRPTTVNVAPTNPRSLWSSRRGSIMDDSMTTTPDRGETSFGSALSFAPVDHHPSRIPHHATPSRHESPSTRIHNTPADPSSLYRNISNTSSSPASKPKPCDSPSYRTSSPITSNIQHLSIDIPRIINSPQKKKLRSNSDSPSNSEPENTTANARNHNHYDDSAASVVSSVSDSSGKLDDDHDEYDNTDDLFSQYEAEVDDGSQAKASPSIVHTKNVQCIIPIVPMEWSSRQDNTSGLSFPILNSSNHDKLPTTTTSSTFATTIQSQSSNLSSSTSNDLRHRRYPSQTPLTQRSNGNDSLASYPHAVEQDLAFLTPTSVCSRKLDDGLIPPHFSFSPDKMTKQSSMKLTTITMAPAIGGQSIMHAHPRKSPKIVHQVHSAPQALELQLVGSNEGFPMRKIKRASTINKPSAVAKSTSVPNLTISSSHIQTKSIIRTESESSEYHERFDDDAIIDEHDDAIVLRNATPTLIDEHKSCISKLKAYQNLLLSASHDGSIRIWGANESESRSILDMSTFTLSSDKRNERKITLGSRKSYTSTDGDTNATAASSSMNKVLNLWCESRCETIWGAYSDSNIRVWSGVEGRPMRLLSGHEEAVHVMEGMEYINGIQSSTVVASGSADKTVRIWDARAKRAQIFLFKGHTDTIMSLKWTEGGRTVVSAGKDKTIKIWDTRAGRLRATLEKHFSAVSGLQAIPEYVGGSSPNISIQPSFLSAGRDSMLYLWTGNGDCIGSQAVHRGNIHYLSEVHTILLYRNSSPTSAIISLGADNCIKIWDIKKNRCLSDIPNHPGTGILSKATWIRNHHVITASNTGAMKLWSYPSSSDGMRLREQASFASLSSLEGSPAHPMNTSSTSDWKCHDLPSHTGAVTDLIANDHLVACSSKSGQILRWNIQV